MKAHSGHYASTNADEIKKSDQEPVVILQRTFIVNALLCTDMDQILIPAYCTANS